MTRFLPVAAAALLGLAALPATAQDADRQEAPADTVDVVVADSTAADSAAVAIQPDPARAAQLAEEGDRLLAAGSFDEAITKYDLGFLYDEANPMNPFGRARALVQLRRYDDARASYETAITLAQAAERTAIVSAARGDLRKLDQGLSARAEAQASAQAIADMITRATTLLGAPDVQPATAQDAYDLLESARESGYDSTLVAFYYGKALNVLGRHDEAIPYAAMAVEAAPAGQDASGYHIQLGLAHMGAENDAEARAAFEAAKEGSWSAWAEHYLREMDKAADEDAEAAEAASEEAEG